MFNKILELIFPTTCGICGKIDKNALCMNCKDKVSKLAKVKIVKFNNMEFEKIMYIFNYKSEISKVILNYKFYEKPYLADFFTSVIINNENICRFFKFYDIIIPVPIHKKRYKTRGYNQSALITRKVAKKLDIITYEDVLLKQKNNVQQMTLNKRQRKENIKNVYRIENSNKIKNKSILLFDDIFTTGSTVNECAKVLKNAGAKRVDVFIIAKD